MPLTMPRTWYTPRASIGDSPAEISIFDEIGSYGVDARMFAADLKALSGNEVTLLVNSPGGDVVQALAICNSIRHSGKTVRAKVMGMAGSAASVLLTACASVEMPENTFQFLHDPLAGMYGDAAEHRATADMLDKIAGPLVAMYAGKSGKSDADIRALLDADSLLTAEECLALGLCDKVTPAITATAKFEVERLPARVQALFRGNHALADAATPFATRVKALADRHGLGEFAAVWVADPALTTIEAAQAAISEAHEVHAVCQVVGKPDRAAALIRARASLPDAKKQLAEVLVADDAASSVDTARSSKSVQGAAKPAPVEINDVWAKYRATNQPRST